MTSVEDLLKQLMSIPSSSGDEAKVCQFVFDLLTKEGFKTKKYPVDDKRFNVVGTLNDKPNIYLQAHLDTVPPHIDFREDQANIYGRGACDTKGSAASMITAGVLAKEQGLKNFGLIFTVGEETCLDGAESLMKEGLKVPFVVVGEPTSLEIVNQHFGFLAVRVKAKGKAAHSSRPEEGINALDLLLETVKKVKNLKTHPETLMSLVRLNGGVADNVIPPSAEAVFSFRISPKDKSNYFNFFESLANDKITIEKIIDVKSIHTDVPKELSFIKVVRTVKYFTELSLFKNGVIIGPGDIKYAHGANEQVSKAELKKAVELYSRIIKNYAQIFDNEYE